jgi:hypothetical protein
MPKKLLEVKSVPFNNKINDDSGSGAKLDISTWKPTLERGWFYLGPAATNGSGDAVGLIVKDLSSDGHILRPIGEKDWIQVWNDAGSGKPTDYSLWQGVPRIKDRANYVVLGGYFNRSHNMPTAVEAAGIRAIHKDVLKLVKPGREVWNDKGTGAKLDGAVWDISVAGQLDAINPGYFIPTPDHDTPPVNTFAIERTKIENRR